MLSPYHSIIVVYFLDLPDRKSQLVNPFPAIYCCTADVDIYVAIIFLLTILEFVLSSSSFISLNLTALHSFVKRFSPSLLRRAFFVDQLMDQLSLARVVYLFKLFLTYWFLYLMHQVRITLRAQSIFRNQTYLTFGFAFITPHTW